MQLNDHFKRQEFACKCGCGLNTVDAELLYILIRLRSEFNRGVYINSGVRCKKYNTSVGGAKNSQHRLGRAADITVNNIHPDIVADWLEEQYPDQYGIGRYNNFTHIDSRSTKARWDLRTQT